MKVLRRPQIVLASFTAGIVLLSLALVLTAAQPRSSRGSRTPDGRPNLNGIWQAMNTANWDIRDHPARPGPIPALGAAFSVPPGLGVVDGNEVPYQQWAADKKAENLAN